MKGELQLLQSEAKSIEKQIEEVTPAAAFQSRKALSFVTEDGSLDWSVFKNHDTPSGTLEGKAHSVWRKHRITLALHGMTSQQHRQALEELPGVELSDTLASTLKSRFSFHIAREAPLEILNDFDGSQTLAPYSFHFHRLSNAFRELTRTDLPAAKAWLDLQIDQGTLVSSDLNNRLEPRFELEALLLRELVQMNSQEAFLRVDQLSEKLSVEKEDLASLTRQARELGITADNSHDPAARLTENEKRQNFSRLVELSQKLAALPIGKTNTGNLEEAELEEAAYQLSSTLLSLLEQSKEELGLLSRIAIRDDTITDEIKLELLQSCLWAHSLKDSRSAAEDAIKLIPTLDIDQKIANELIEEFVTEHAKRNPLNAYPWLAYLEDLLSFPLDRIRGSLLVSLAHIDPSAAFDVAELEDLSGRRAAYRLLGFGLTSENAREFFKAARRANLKRRALLELYSGMVGEDS